MFSGGFTPRVLVDNKIESALDHLSPGLYYVCLETLDVS